MELQGIKGKGAQRSILHVWCLLETGRFFSAVQGYKFPGHLLLALILMCTGLDYLSRNTGTGCRFVSSHYTPSKQAGRKKGKIGV